MRFYRTRLLGDSHYPSETNSFQLTAMGLAPDNQLILPEKPNLVRNSASFHDRRGNVVLHGGHSDESMGFRCKGQQIGSPQDQSKWCTGSQKVLQSVHRSVLQGELAEPVIKDMAQAKHFCPFFLVINWVLSTQTLTVRKY